MLKKVCIRKKNESNGSSYSLPQYKNMFILMVHVKIVNLYEK